MTCLFFSMTEGQTKTADINERKDEGKNQIRTHDKKQKYYKLCIY